MDRGACQAAVHGVTESDTTEALSSAHKQVTSEHLLYRPGNYWVLCGDLRGEEIQQDGVRVYVELVHFAVQQKLTQRYKATPIQEKLF